MVGWQQVEPFFDFNFVLSFIKRLGKFSKFINYEENYYAAVLNCFKNEVKVDTFKIF